MASLGVFDILRELKRLEQEGEISARRRKEIWEKVLKEGPTEEIVEQVVSMQESKMGQANDLTDSITEEKTTQEEDFNAPEEQLQENLPTHVVDMRKAREDEPMRCPKCGSKQLLPDKKGFSFGKAAVGGVLLGPLGLALGAHGRKKIKLTCLSCGYVFMLSDAINKKRGNYEYYSFESNKLVPAIIIGAIIIFIIFMLNFNAG